MYLYYNQFIKTNEIYNKIPPSIRRCSFNSSFKHGLSTCMTRVSLSIWMFGKSTSLGAYISLHLNSVLSGSITSAVSAPFHWVEIPR